jgi:hypothetical protein
VSPGRSSSEGQGAPCSSPKRGGVKQQTPREPSRPRWPEPLPVGTRPRYNLGGLTGPYCGSLPFLTSSGFLSAKVSPCVVHHRWHCSVKRLAPSAPRDPCLLLSRRSGHRVHWPAFRLVGASADQVMIKPSWSPGREATHESPQDENLARLVWFLSSTRWLFLGGGHFVGVAPIC